ncbi:uncharacterized protein UHOD_11076 [Ustilago sp. UG-2017b]|nr:uncharacterized protein UHOD_11076 [Ustilago sp. UG-2017b]
MSAVARLKPEIGSSIGAITDPVELCDNTSGITIPSEICNRAVSITFSLGTVVARHDQYQYVSCGNTKVWWDGLLPSVLSLSGPLFCYEPLVMGLNAQEAGRPLVHMEGAQVSGDQTDQRGEAVDLAGTGSKHGRSTVSMETMDEEACITNSHAKEDQAHMQGGPNAYARRTEHRQEEDQAQGACRRVLLRDSRDRGQRNRCRSKEEEQCIGDR